MKTPKKKFIYPLLILVSGMITNTNATIIQVNNNPGTAADHSSLQAAIDNANDNDTIYVVGSPDLYDGRFSVIRLNKPLTIIGPGYFLGENNGGVANNETAKVFRLIIGEGANNALVMGLDMNHDGSSFTSIENTKRDGSTGTQGPSNVTIKRNIMQWVYMDAGTNIVIEQNFIDYSVNSGGVRGTIEIRSSAANILIQNNIMVNRRDGASIDGRDDTFSGVTIKNNTLLNEIEDLHGAEIISNIFLNDLGLKNCDNGQVKNNVFTSAVDIVIDSESTGNTASDNVFSANQTSLFVEDVPALDSEYQLDENSPAKGVGFNGVDTGAYGGPGPYQPSGIPPIPIITELTTTGVGTESEGITIRVKARSNQ